MSKWNFVLNARGTVATVRRGGTFRFTCLASDAEEIVMLLNVGERHKDRKVPQCPPALIVARVP